MTIQNFPAGWYPDANTPGQMRWWDGAQWTDRVQAPYSATTAYGATAGSAAGAATGTWQVWTINGLFALQLVVSLLYIATIDWGAYMAYSANPTPGDVDALFAMFNIGYFATLLVSFLAYGGSVALAYFDVKELASRGVERPFHWAWNFIPSYGTTVYIIGRSVVVRRRTGGGLAPLWGYIVLFVVGMIASVFATMAMMGSMLSELSTLPMY